MRNLVEQRIACSAVVVATSTIPCVACKNDAAVVHSPTDVAAAASGAVVAGTVPSAEWYPPGTNQELRLTWTIHPIVGESDGGPKRKLEVVTRIGDAVKRVSLGPQVGTLLPSEQSVCNRALTDEIQVSVIRFHTMGPKTIVARRIQPTLLEIMYTVDADDEPSKTRGTLTTIPIPADARIVDAISEILEAGKESPLDCSSMKPGGGK